MKRKRLILLIGTCCFLMAAAFFLALFRPGSSTSFKMEVEEPVKERRPDAVKDDPMTAYIKADAQNPGAEPPPELKEGFEALAEQRENWLRERGFDVDSGGESESVWTKKYTGPQTPEALIEEYGVNTSFDREQVRSVLQKVLDRGVVIEDYDDYTEYVDLLISEINHYRQQDEIRKQEWRMPRPPDRPAHMPWPPTVRSDLGLPEDASWEEVDNALIDRRVQEWPNMKEWTRMCLESKEPLVRVRLNGQKGGALWVGEMTKADFSEEEKYLIAYHGIAPKRAKVFYVEEDNWTVIPPEKVKLADWKFHVAEFDDERLQEEYDLFSQGPPSESSEWSALQWMRYVDQAEAVFNAVAERRMTGSPPPESPIAPPVSPPSGLPQGALPPPGMELPPPALKKGPFPPSGDPVEQAAFAVAAAKALDLYLEANEGLSSEARELLKLQKEAYLQWLERRPPVKRAPDEEKLERRGRSR